MITPLMLNRWKHAKVLAVTNPNTDAEVCIALQEILLEVRELRRDNLKLLNRQDLLNLALTYIGLSLSEHYLSPDLESLYDDIEELCKQANLEIPR